MQLDDLVQGRSTEVPQVDSICQADRCDLGRWLGGTGRLRLGHYPAFDMLVARHQYFHQQAAAVVDLLQVGDQLIEHVVWFVNYMGSRGITLRAGQFITTGTWTGMPPLRAGQTGTARYSTLGAISATMTGK